MFAFHAVSELSGGKLDGVHLIWSPPFPTGHALDGFTIERRLGQRPDGSHCFTLTSADLDRARRLGVLLVPDAAVWASPNNQIEPLKGSWTFRCDLVQRHDTVNISASQGLAGFAARADGKVITAAGFSNGACRLAGADIATVWFVLKNLDAPVTVCGDLRDAGKWGDAKVIVSGLKMPFRAVDPSLGSVAAEHKKAVEQAKPEPFDGVFDDLSRYANAALRRPFASAAWRVSVNDPTAAASDWDTLPFGLVTALSGSSPLRRGLGLGFIDHFDLTPGQAYDYRIRGNVPRADRDEARVDFYTVPRGYVLPSRFALGDVVLHVTPAPVIEAETDASGGLTALRKLIRFKRLRISLPTPTVRVVIDGDSNGALDVIGVRAGLPVANLSVLLGQRTLLEFATPVDEVILKGDGGALAGLVASPLAAGLDPKEPVEISAAVYGVVYAPGAPPPPPTAIDVDNLGSAARAARRAQRDDHLGFEIAWDPPGIANPAVLAMWPVDAQSAPPTEVAGYVLERSVGGGPFAGLEGSDGLHFGARNSDPVTQAPTPGSDLLAAFPPADKVGIAADLRTRALDVIDNGEIALGTNVTYRVASLDVIGRRSTPVVSAPIQLRKLTRPPTPIAPPLPLGPVPDLPLLAQPNGIVVRLLQSEDPDLTDDERARIVADGEVVVLRWGWGPEQRTLDPHVTEFRVYEAAGRLIEILARVTGPATSTGTGGWLVPCSFSRPIGANEFVGRSLVMGGAFRVIAHPAGAVVTLEVIPIGPPTAMPVGDGFALMRTTGAEEDPSYWDRRLLTVPRTGDPADPTAIEAYEVAAPAAWIAVDASRPTQTRTFGVSAADDQAYIPDRRQAVEPIPRPGNEGAVAHGEVVARFRSRPDLTIADLADVASIVAPRAAGDAVTVTFRPADLLPAGVTAGLLTRIERCPASAILSRIVVDATSIQLRLQSGALVAWPLSAADQATLRAGLEVRATPDKFLAAAAQRLGPLDDFERIADADPTRELRDPLPNSPVRWVYRLRALDAAGHVSDAAQVLQAVVRTPTPAPALAPELVSLKVEAGVATVRLKDRSGGTAAALFLVQSNDPRLRPVRAELATIRNRPDLSPLEALVIRDDRGQRLTLTPVTPDADGAAELTLAAPTGNTVNVWALAVSSDGIPSRLVGPLTAPSGFPAEVD